MKTKIIIEFEKEIPKDTLIVLLGQLHAQCSENKEGYGWGGGSYTLETNIIENETNKSKRDVSSTKG